MVDNRATAALEVIGPVIIHYAPWCGHEHFAYDQYCYQLAFLTRY